MSLFPPLFRSTTEQDDLIDILGGQISRLHDRAIDINQESSLHTALIEDIDDDVGDTTSKLRDETAHAKQVKNERDPHACAMRCDPHPCSQIRQQGGVCKLYITIGGLFALMLVLIFIGLG